MIDATFYDVNEVSASDIAGADSFSGEHDLQKAVIKSVAAFENAREFDLTFVEKAKQLNDCDEAVVCFAPVGASTDYSGPALLIETRFPRGAFAKAAKQVVTPKWGWSSTQLIDPSAVLEDNVILAPNVTIGPNVRIGAGTRISPGTVISTGVTIGRDCSIGSNCTISFAHIGDGVTILSGSVIGDSGFGLAESAEGLLDTPHFGRVIIQDGVSIGSCVTIDRGLFEDTEIGTNVKIDNLSQIAHNVKVGPNTVMAAFAGLAGSANIGAGVMMGGRVGVADHINVGTGARLGAGAATMKDVPPGETWVGVPAKPLKMFFREVAWLAKAASGKS